MNSFFPTPALSDLVLTSSLQNRISSLPGAGNWLARFGFCVARQPFSCLPDGLDRGDHGPARSVILKSLHDARFESGAQACHGANGAVVRHV